MRRMDLPFSLRPKVMFALEIFPFDFCVDFSLDILSVNFHPGLLSRIGRGRIGRKNSEKGRALFERSELHRRISLVLMARDFGRTSRRAPAGNYRVWATCRRLDCERWIDDRDVDNKSELDVR